MKLWGGPLDANWRRAQADLQRFILSAQRMYGMIGVLPGFAGHVPDAIVRIFPDAVVTRSAAWGGFNQTYTCNMLLEPADKRFVAIGKRFVELLTEEFGTDHFYNADTYNEMEVRRAPQCRPSAAVSAPRAAGR